MSRAQSRDRLVDFPSLAFEMINLRSYLLRLKLFFEIVAGVLGADKFADLGEREPELLSLQDHLQAQPVGVAVQPGSTVTTRAKELAIFVEPERAKAHTEFGRELTDRHFPGGLS